MNNRQYTELYPVITDLVNGIFRIKSSHIKIRVRITGKIKTFAKLYQIIHIYPSFHVDMDQAVTTGVL